MIVYNVARGWFPMKNDAEAHRRELGLPPAANTKVVINDRNELAALLNGMMGLTAEASPAGAVLEPQVVEPEVIQRNQVEVPECVPEFLVKEWARRSGINPDDIKRVSEASSETIHEP
ncbi:hypothetical protein [Aquibium oceanicum]|uniref:Uncharacterized protein n=1 Tax=Aquibium oceanicum TaxID=1670800 RepID=A0A1L3SXK1_9HYPH|nr:hypothetical protein [Aquibium oceanicum]APH74128.1 hypothetical protein BSQ44_24225 [Aquibium oceanicum]